MRDRIGTTRSGKPIEVIWAFVDGLRIVESLSSFTDAEDEFDAIAVTEAKSMLGQRSRDKVAQYESALLHHVVSNKRREFGEDKFWEIGAVLGIVTSYDVNELGRSLLYPRQIGRG